MFIAPILKQPPLTKMQSRENTMARVESSTKESAKKKTSRHQRTRQYHRKQEAIVAGVLPDRRLTKKERRDYDTLSHFFPLLGPGFLWAIRKVQPEKHDDEEDADAAADAAAAPKKTRLVLGSSPGSELALRKGYRYELMAALRKHFGHWHVRARFEDAMTSLFEVISDEMYGIDEDEHPVRFMAHVKEATASEKYEHIAAEMWFCAPGVHFMPAAMFALVRFVLDARMYATERPGRHAVYERTELECAVDNIIDVVLTRLRPGSEAYEAFLENIEREEPREGEMRALRHGVERLRVAEDDDEEKGKMGAAAEKVYKSAEYVVEDDDDDEMQDVSSRGLDDMPKGMWEALQNIDRGGDAPAV
jgi:hypothetical protein